MFCCGRSVTSHSSLKGAGGPPDNFGGHLALVSRRGGGGERGGAALRTHARESLELEEGKAVAAAAAEARKLSPARSIG